MFDYVLMAAAFRLDRITIDLRVSCIEDSVLPLIVENASGEYPLQSGSSSK